MAKQMEQPPTPVPDDDASTTWWLAGTAVVLLALAGWMGWEVYPALAAQSWPTAQGTVHKLKVWEKSKVGATSGPRQYQVEIEYEYTVNGQTLTGTTFNTRNNHIDADAVSGVQQKYKAGEKCTVYHSSSVPSNSILVADSSTTAWGKLVIGVLALIGAVLLLVLAFRKPKQPPG